MRNAILKVQDLTLVAGLAATGAIIAGHTRHGRATGRRDEESTRYIDINTD